MAIQLKDHEREFIKKILQTHLPKAHFFVFGSRHQGTAKPYSDLDIAVDNKKSIPLAMLSKLEEQFAVSNLVFKIDLIDFQRVAPEFQQRILKAYEEL